MRFFFLSATAVAIGCLLAVGGVAAAQTAASGEDDGIHLDFRAPPGCPDAAQFRTQLQARLRPATAGKHVGGDLTVTVAEAGKRLSAQLVIRSGGKVVGTREVDGETCKDVISAIALAAALDLDARAEAQPESPLTPPVEPPPPPPPAPSPVERPWQLAAGLHASVTEGVADGALFGAPVFLDVGARATRLGSPSLRLLFEGTVSGSIPEAVGSLRFLWLTGALEGCPIRWGSLRFAVRPCAREAGTLRGSPQGVSFGHPVTLPWVSAGVVARGEWDPTGSIFFEIEGGIRAPIVREQFVFLPGETLYRVPAASALAEIGAGLHFSLIEGRLPPH